MAQGLAHGAGLRIAAVSSLAAVAVEVFAETDAREAVVAQDAHMNEVYLGTFARAEGGLPRALFVERLHGQVPIEELEPEGAAGRIAAGAGWSQYPTLLAANQDRVGVHAGYLYPRARHLLLLGAAAVRRNDLIDPAIVAPAYLRQKVAEPERKDAVT
jgi:tRNA threonylcarbamoyladenosine biosynthesis protein TsaB